MTASDPNRVLIVGAGIAGLAAALRLHRAGRRPVVVERSPARRGGGYAVAFAGVGYDAAERMGVLPALAERHITPDEMVYLKPSGAVSFTVPGETVRSMVGERSLSLLRGDIEDVLYQAVRDHAEFRFGTVVEEIAQDEREVRARLSDGTTVTAELLVGADGLHSATRTQVFGPEADFRRDLDHMAGVFMLDRLPEGVPAGATVSLTDAGRTLAIIDLGQGRAAAFFGYRTTDPQGELAAGAAAALPRAFADVGWVAPEVLARLAAADSVYFDTISQMVVPRWSRGRVVLLGDAAWCVTLFAGYGSSLAVGGADLLGTALEEHPGDIPAALAAWEERLRPETERKQRLGRRVKGLYAPVSPVARWVRDLPLRMASYPWAGRLLQRRLQLKG
ncbi:FAD-dependent oxidoreductase [Allonocardiopsis opalescens]|uniref:2-polyprenyl-6-methoxyphenol hydroxylase-like FAD-dependent oxidoreductase n=1 Tax=Allonocardiopsis opalescens TaxID=1144618 RepID=A0A2T0QF96_9ACTN|nr:FAD-dependent oxidoreductase [Allonocardiopsis opalescens]PRY02521.1 2-polyprenyl-6-methoxyphenol hydroxylase-like FAD-dependent oxidoreductase [Allonocardiopsis opalescens]